jgi:hypothetical protein
MSAGIITSAAYINPEMSAELGPLPPAFLPAGNTRLFRYQAELLQRFARKIFLSLPESFCVPDHDAHLLVRLGIQVIRIPDGLSLAESVMLAVIQSIECDEPVFILHGDTLFLDLQEFPPDRISVHKKSHPYPWAIIEAKYPVRIGPLRQANGSPQEIVSGLFSFSHSLALLKCLARAGKDFLAALNQYAAEIPEFQPASGAGEWLDFGHLNTYYGSRRTLTTERDFNALSIEGDVVCKTSLQVWKMHAEASWFESLPVSFKPYVPAYLGRTGGDTGGYRLAYEFLCPLSDLYVFGALPTATWQRILSACARLLARFREHKPPEIESEWFEHLYPAKAERRFAQFAAANNFSPGAEWRLNGVPLPSATTIIAQMANCIGPAVVEQCGILHGDFCLSNILFDFRRDAVKLLDPRGYILPDVPTLHGDTRYDVGKLHHSISGGYDFILAGYFTLSRDGERGLLLEVVEAQRQREIERLFLEIVCDDDTGKLQTAAAISVLLFLSMLTLHADDPNRQWALFGNALRIYRRFFGGSA